MKHTDDFVRRRRPLRLAVDLCLILTLLFSSLAPLSAAGAAAEVAQRSGTDSEDIGIGGVLSAPRTVHASPSSGTVTTSKAIEGGVTSIPAGDWFTYLINYAYASTTEPGQNVVLVDDLDPDLSWAAGDVVPIGTAHIASTSFNPATGRVTFTFVNPLPAGSSGQIQLHVRFPNGSTPNGTVAVNTATIDGDNTDPATSNSVSITATATCQWEADVTGPLAAQIGANVTYRATLKRPSPAEGNLDVTSGAISLTLPVGVLPADVVNVSGGTLSGTGVAGDPVVVTWNTGMLSADDSAGSTAFTQSLVFKYDAARFTAGQTVAVFEQANLTVVGGGSCTKTDTMNTNLTNLTPGPDGMAEKDSSDEEVELGDPFTYYLDAESAGNVGLENFTINDPLPQNFALASIRLPTVQHGPGGNFITLKYRRSDTGATEYVWPGSPFAANPTTLNVSALSLPTGVYVSHVTFEFGAVASSFRINSNILLIGSLISPGWGSPPQTLNPGDDVCNTMTLTADYNSAPAVNETSTKCVELYQPKIRPEAWKYKHSATLASVAPGQPITWYAEVGNNSSAGLVMANGMGMDLLPAEMDYVAGSFAFVDATNFDPAVPNYNNAGATAGSLTFLGRFPTTTALVARCYGGSSITPSHREPGRRSHSRPPSKPGRRRAILLISRMSRSTRRRRLGRSSIWTPRPT